MKKSTQEILEPIVDLLLAIVITLVLGGIMTGANFLTLKIQQKKGMDNQTQSQGGIVRQISSDAKEGEVK